MAAAAGAEECLFVEFFSGFRSKVRHFWRAFWTRFRYEITRGFGVARPCGQGLRAEAWSLVVAAAAGAEEYLFVDFFLGIQKSR